MTELEKAQQKYKDYIRNYYHWKDQYEDYYNNNINSKITKKEIIDIEHRMNHAFDVTQTLVYIFGNSVR